MVFNIKRGMEVIRTKIRSTDVRVTLKPSISSVSFASCAGHLHSSKVPETTG
eukprot:gene8496-17523_t